MSIEDPRLSSIDNTSAADDFDSAVEQHLGFASETVEGIEVAQAETPDAGRTDRLPSQAPVQAAAAVIPTEVTPNAENVGANLCDLHDARPLLSASTARLAWPSSLLLLP